MALYDEIKNAFDKDETLIEIINMSYNGYVAYRKFVHDPNYKKDMHEKHLENFNTYIKNPNIGKLYEYISKNASNIDTKIKAKIDEINKRTDIDKDQKIDLISIIHLNKLYPVSEYNSIFNQFKSFDEINNLFKKHNLDSQRKDLFKCIVYKDNKQYRENLKQKNNFTDEQLDEILTLEKLRRKLHLCFKHTNTMGFHVNPQSINPDNKMINNYSKNINIKFYVNVGADSYQFANLFQKKCEEKQMNYMYKVVDAWTADSEDHRKDRICLWSSYEDAEKFINILKEIKKEHPEFDYQKPPIICGTIDDFIGVGIDFGGSSYNHSMSIICTSAIENIFGKINKEEILKIISNNPNKLNELRNEIKRLAKEKGLDPEKMCIKNDTKDKISNNNVIKLDENLYIDRNTYEKAQKKKIDIEGTPKIINNRNYYRITKEQLNELNTDKKTDTDNKQTINNNTSSYIIIYNDKITNKKYIKEKDLGYKKDNPKTIMNNTCYEISDEEINKLNKKVVSVSIYLKQKKTIKVSIATINNELYIPDEYFDKDNKKHIKIDGTLYTEINETELAKLKQQLNSKDIEIIFTKKNIIKKNTTSNNLIPGTNIPKPRNRGLYETDQEYTQFLKEYYDKVFNKKNELNDMFKNNNSIDTKEKNK